MKKSSLILQIIFTVMQKIKLIPLLNSYYFKYKELSSPTLGIGILKTWGEGGGGKLTNTLYFYMQKSSCGMQNKLSFK